MPAAEAIRYALNHMVAPQLALPQLFALARQLGLSDVEIRNDIAGEAIADGTPARIVRRQAADAGISILSINALQKFNHWSSERRAEAEALADYAAEAGSAALVLVAANDGTRMGDAERVANAAESIAGLMPILQSRNVTGLVECLGFAVCSLRSKREALQAIDAAGGRDVFKLTHDTFHHHLAGEPDLFPEMTGLVHISGVDDRGIAVADMRDSHRVLVGPRDRLGNIAQIEALRDAGCRAPLSFEPFAEDLRQLADPAPAIAQSIEFMRTRLAAMAA